MNEVEKLYRNAGVKYYKEICAIKNVIDKISNQECYFEVCCTSCPLNKTSFTAEKQLFLLQLLARKSHITIGLGLPWGQYDDSWWTVTSKNGGLGTNAYKFEEALASFVNSKWQDLTEEERKQIKEILE